MTKSEAIAFYGTQQKLAEALGMSQGSISLWGDQPPALRQIQLQTITRGKLKADPGCKLPARMAPKKSQHHYSEG
jgi:hypothetical protein